MPQGCFSDMGICLQGTLTPCCLHEDNSMALGLAGEGCDAAYCCLLCCNLGLPLPNIAAAAFSGMSNETRRTLRANHNLKEAPCDDQCVTCM